MRIVQVIEARVWLNKITGQKASPYGALPWTRKSDKAQWELVSRGFTWEMSNGTVGLGIPPAATREEAEAVMAHYNARFA
jgi:hypothetical protein